MGLFARRQYCWCGCCCTVDIPVESAISTICPLCAPRRPFFMHVCILSALSIPFCPPPSPPPPPPPPQTPGATTQLWRMAAEGQLVHIASSESSGQDMVLDVAYNLPRRPGEYTPLVLSRRTQSSRLAYQTWRFTGDYLVLKETQNLCVQSRKGFESFREGKCSTNLFTNSFFLSFFSFQHNQ